MVFSGEDRLTFLGKDGRGAKSLDFRQGNLKKNLSPNLDWIVIVSYEDKDNPEIQIRNLVTDEIVSIAKVLREDYPEGMEEVETYHTFEDYDAGEVTPDIEWLFPDREVEYQWSPDGKKLAYISQKDGPSNNIYVFDIETRENIQLTDDLMIKHRIYWSPSSEYLVFKIYYPFTGFNLASGFYSLNYFDRVTRYPNNIISQYGWDYSAWYSSDSIILYRAGDGAGYYNLSVYNIKTNQVQLIWKNSYSSYYMFEDAKSILVSDFNHEHNIQFKDSSGVITKLFDFGFFWIIPWKPDEGKFFGYKEDGIFYFDLESNLVQIWDKNDSSFPRDFSVSPENIFFSICDRDQLIIFEDINKSIFEFPKIDCVGTLWNPDETGLFIFAKDEGTYYLDIQSLELKHILPYVIDSRNYIWVP